METHQKSDVNTRITLAFMGLILLAMNAFILPLIDEVFGFTFPKAHASLQNAFNPIGFFFISLCICWRFFTKYLAGNLLSQILTILLAIASLYIGNKDTSPDRDTPEIDLNDESIERIASNISKTSNETHLTLLPAQHRE